MPLTLKTLYAFKSNKAWSGVEVAAFVFHQLFSQKKIVKAGVIKHLNDALELRNGRSCKLLNIIQEMACEKREEEPFPVSKSVNKCLTDLAGNSVLRSPTSITETLYMSLGRRSGACYLSANKLSFISKQFTNQRTKAKTYLALQTQEGRKKK